MRRDLIRLPKLDSSFLSVEKDTETILRRLFVESNPYSEQLKRLLVINTKDCLDNIEDEKYNKIIKEMDLAMLRQKDYIKIEPKIKLEEHADVKSYIIISFDNFYPNGNPQSRDCMVVFDILCHTDYWDIGNYRLRPFKIIGIIDGLLNNTKLSGIGTLQFAGCNQLILDHNFSGYTLMYNAVHMTDDRLEVKED
jgi:hypothetical protein